MAGGSIMFSSASVRDAFRSICCVAALAALLNTARTAAGATVADSPHVGPPTSVTWVSGVGYGPAELVDLYFDSAKLKTVTAASTGSFPNAYFVIPGNAVPEQHWIKAVGRTTKRSAQIPYWVHTDWPQIRATAGHTNANAYENLLNAETLSTAHLLWSAPVPGSSTGGGTDPIVANGRVYVGQGTQLTSFRTTTGALQWTVTLGAGLTTPAAMTVPGSGGYVVFTGSDAGVTAYREDGTLWWRKTPGGTGWQVVAVDNGLVYALQGGLRAPGQLQGEVRAPGHLYALKAKDGSVAWQRTINYGYADLPAVANGILYTISAHSFGNTLSAYNAATGSPLWGHAVAPVNASYLQDLIATPDGVYVTAGVQDSFSAMGLYAFLPSTGVRKWFYQDVFPPFLYAVSGGFVYEAVLDYSSVIEPRPVRRLDAATGAFVNDVAKEGEGGYLGLYDGEVSNGVIYGRAVPYDNPTAWAVDDGRLVRDFSRIVPGEDFSPRGLAIADAKLFYVNGASLVVIGNE
jgi:hypothetical protein